MLYTVEVDTAQLPQADIDTIETYLFANEHEGQQFRDHLRDLYGLDVNVGYLDVYTYDKAIEDFVERFGPSEE